MKPLILSIGSILLLSVTIGCDNDTDHDRSGATAESAAHDDHDHAHAHDHAGEKIPLDELAQAGPYEVSAVQNGALTPGGEVNFDIEILGEPRPKSVRFWLGPETVAEAEKKSPEEVKETVYHVDLSVPATLTEGTKLWVEIEPPTGETVRASLAPMR